MTYNYEQAKTQKARGVLLACPVLQAQSVNNCVRSQYKDVYNLELENESNRPMLFTSVEEVNKFIINNLNFWAFGKNIFARPCPRVPRHGFIESKIIKNHEELLKTITDIKKEDPDGELILTPFINDSTVNAVLTSSGLLSIGPGHDGATAGKNSFSIPVKPWTDIPQTLIDLAGLKDGDGIFLEAVFCHNSNGDKLPFQITQIRGGPQVAAVSDFIPKKMKIESIIFPLDDLLVWEKTVKSFSPGTVVYGDGHSLASHAAIHCVINNIPFITSFYPVIGDVIKPNNNKTIKYNKLDFLKGVNVALKKSFKLEVMLHISASILHNWSYIRNSEHASWLLGVSASYMCQVLLALCYGEFRHSNLHNEFYNTDRADVYTMVISENKIYKYMARTPILAAAFVDKKKFCGSEFGGTKWAQATKMCIKIWNSIINIQENRLNQQSINRLINNINKSTNLVHNNGCLFNKFSSSNILNKISEQPNHAIFELSDYLFTIKQEVDKIVQLKEIKKLKPIKVSK